MHLLRVKIKRLKILLLTLVFLSSNNVFAASRRVYYYPYRQGPYYVSAGLIGSGWHTRDPVLVTQWGFPLQIQIGGMTPIDRTLFWELAGLYLAVPRKDPTKKASSVFKKNSPKKSRSSDHSYPYHSKGLSVSGKKIIRLSPDITVYGKLGGIYLSHGRNFTPRVLLGVGLQYRLRMIDPQAFFQVAATHIFQGSKAALMRNKSSKRVLLGAVPIQIIQIGVGTHWG